MSSAISAAGNGDVSETLSGLRPQRTGDLASSPQSSATRYSEKPLDLIPQLCSLFYRLGWVTGTGGGVSIRQGDEIFVAPSGVQKEALFAPDIFVYRKTERLTQSASSCDACEDGTHPQHPLCSGEREDDFAIISRPANTSLRPSQCTPLFFAAFVLRGAGAVIHTHSENAVLAAALSDTNEFEISHQEMIKGVPDELAGTNFCYDSLLVLPIIDNTPHERDLRSGLLEAMRQYPHACAVLVRHHGVYVWGRDWISAKTTCECLDYLFKMKVELHKIGRPWQKPTLELSHEEHKCLGATTL